MTRGPRSRPPGDHRHTTGRRSEESTRRRFAGRDRGQTALDFAIGVSLFLVVVAFVVAFIPSIFVPFTDTDRTQAADRAATALAANQLAQPDEPYLLNRSCTADFFDRYDGSLAAADDSCRFDTTATSVNDALGVASLVKVNITIETLDGDMVEIDVDGDGDADVDLRAGQSVPGGRGVTTARRVVRLGGQSRRLIVRTW